MANDQRGAGGAVRRLMAACLRRLQRHAAYRRLAGRLPLPVSIRAASAHEVAVLWRIAGRQGQAPVYGSATRTRHYVVRVAGLLAGHALLVAQPPDSQYWPGYWINDVFVRTPFRGQGLGRRLLQYVMHAAAEDGAAEVFLLVNQGNEPALTLYRSLGFRAFHNSQVDGVLARQAQLYGVRRLALRAPLGERAAEAGSDISDKGVPQSG